MASRRCASCRNTDQGEVASGRFDMRQQRKCPRCVSASEKKWQPEFPELAPKTQREHHGGRW